MEIACYVSGSILILLGVLDVFLSILYARSGTGILAPYANRIVWHIFRRTAIIFGKKRDATLSYCGPVLLVVIIALWAALLVCGFALISWPQLGEGIRKSSGAADQGSWTALYYSGYCFTTLGVGNLTPATPLWRMIAVLEAAIGFSFFTLAITYIVSVYSALRRRNTFALFLHYKTAGTGDPARYLLSLFRHGESSETRAHLAGITEGLSDLFESHHLYPVLHYFRFREVRYALPRIILIAIESASLSATLPKKSGGKGVAPSAAVDELWTAGMNVIEHLSDNFLPKKLRKPGGEIGKEETEKWRRRFFDLAEEMRTLGIEPSSDLNSSASEYVRLRGQWNRYIVSFCRSQLFEIDDAIPFKAVNSTRPPTGGFPVS